METVPIVVLMVYGLAALFSLAAIIVLIIRRVRIRKRETFEKRKN